MAATTCPATAPRPTAPVSASSPWPRSAFWRPRSSPLAPPLGPSHRGPPQARQLAAPAPDHLTWLAGLLDSLGTWWDGQSTGSKIAIGIGIAALVALSGGSLGLSFGVSGVGTYLLAHGHGAADFVRDPRTATRSYHATTTPMGLVADSADAILTFGPWSFAGATAERGIRLAAGGVRPWRRAGGGRVRPGAGRREPSLDHDHLCGRPRPARGHPRGGRRCHPPAHRPVVTLAAVRHASRRRRDGGMRGDPPRAPPKAQGGPPEAVKASGSPL